MNSSITVAVTGAAGQIGYALLPRLASGEIFGPDVRVNLKLIEIEPVLPKLEGTAMELTDCAFGALGDITCTADIETGFGDADWVLLLGSMPRGIVVDGRKIEERSDLLRINGGIFTDQGRAIGRFARPDARVLVVGNPANTNALIGRSHARQEGQLWMAMTALDANRAAAQLARRSGSEVRSVRRLCIWGNHSPTMYPDVFNAQIGGQPGFEAIGSDQAWLESDFLPVVQQRGKAIIEARGASSAMSAASSALDTVMQVARPTEAGDCFSAAVFSDGRYDIPEGLMCGLPLFSDGGSVRVIDDFEISDLSRRYIDASVAELIEERDAVRDLIG
ncbi:MAG: malate dehydrogenase [Gammaproteobacteria bacterium AqS3]|nr:malate dehydrogenase [Gammaproteobacteria bacterium AqS3]